MNKTNERLIVAKWILNCDDSLKEIEFLLNIVFPYGAKNKYGKDKFYEAFGYVLSKTNNKLIYDEVKNEYTK